MLVTLSLSRKTLHPITPADARRAWMEHRAANGFTSYQRLLTPPSANLKLEKSGKDAVVYGLSLAPSNLSGHNVCAFSTPECRRGCVAYAGMGRYDSVTAARVSKTRFLMQDPSAFVAILVDEIDRAATRHGDALAVRLNTFSDLPWERLHPHILRPDVRFYDYTKDWSRTSTSAYHLTFSASERTTDAQIVEKVSEGENVAVVFDTTRTKALPESYLGIPVVDGDKTDVRDLDPAGVVVGLRAKGRMRSTGQWNMVRRTADC